jgi:hypothetical protein
MPTSISESVLEQQFIDQLEDLKYSYRGDIRDRASLHANFREKFESLNRCKLTDKESAPQRDTRGAGRAKATFGESTKGTGANRRL